MKLESIFKGNLQIFQNFPEINIDDKYYLRQFKYEDAPTYLNYMQDERVNQFVPNECLPKTLEMAKEEVKYNLDLFKYKRSFYWAIARKDNDELVGSVGFNYWNQDHTRAELSYDMNPAYWNKGIATKATHTALQFAFVNMKVNRVEANVVPINKASLRVLQKLKFKREGIMREQKILHGKYHDAILLSLLSREHLGF